MAKPQSLLPLISSIFEQDLADTFSKFDPTLQFLYGQLLQVVTQVIPSATFFTSDTSWVVTSKLWLVCSSSGSSTESSHFVTELQSLHSLGVPLQEPPKMAGEQVPLVSPLLKQFDHIFAPTKLLPLRSRVFYLAAPTLCAGVPANVSMEYALHRVQIEQLAGEG